MRKKIRLLVTALSVAAIACMFTFGMTHSSAPTPPDQPVVIMEQVSPAEFLKLTSVNDAVTVQCTSVAFTEMIQRHEAIDSATTLHVTGATESEGSPSDMERSV